MREGESGWFYVGNGQLRYKDSAGWTDKFQDIDGPGTTPPTVGIMTSDPPGAKVSRKGKRPHRRTSILAAVVCVVLLGAALLNTDVLHGWVSWATVQGHFSALISPTTPPIQAIAAKAKMKSKVKVKAKPRTKVMPKAKVPAKVMPAKSVTPQAPAAAHASPSAPNAKPRAVTPLSAPQPPPAKQPHTRTASDCLGSLVATSHVRASGSRATLSGVIRNETGFDVDVSTDAPVVSAFDTNGEHVVLYGDFDTPPHDYGGQGRQVVLHAGGTMTYRSLSVVMQTPDRNWDGSRGWRPVAQFADFEVQTFCQQREVPAFQVVE